MRSWMGRIRICCSAALLLGLGGLPGFCQEPGQTAADAVQQCTDQLCAIPDQPWRTIPWQVDLLEAQRMAIELQKPIFVWAMDGHPLTCT